MKTALNHKENRHILFRIIICVLILIAGLTGMQTLAGLKKPPAQAKSQEQSLKVEIIRAEKKPYPVTITGYGEVQSLNIAPIASEASGIIIEIHPRLETGEIIPQNDVLFRIDPRDYQTAVRTGRERLNVLNQSLKLEEKEFHRIKRLFEENKVGTASGVDMAEKILLASNDMRLQVKHGLELAEFNLDRCTINSPFNGRIRQVSVEKGQFVVPGQNLVTLVDDSILEIHVPIDSRDAGKWLLFDGAKFPENNKGWFQKPAKVPCVIQWTENAQARNWEGELHRIIKFEQKTRTLTLAVRIRKSLENGNPATDLPLVEGMFCIIHIPGKTMENVTRLPRWSVSFENTAFVAVDNRLKTIPVKVERVEGDFVYISEGLEDGDSVITTRLIHPLENSLLTIINP